MFPSPFMFNFPLFIVFLCDNFFWLKKVKKKSYFKKIQKFGQKMSKRFSSVFLDPTEPKLQYSVNSVRIGRPLLEIDSCIRWSYTNAD